MFGKLCKLEGRYLIRFFGPMWALVLVLSVINRYTFWSMVNETGSGLVGGLSMLALVMAACAMCVVALVAVLQRFYNGLLKDEGYLMFTLPVKSGALINAKGLMATLFIVVTGIVGVLIFVIIGSKAFLWSDITAGFRVFLRYTREMGISGFDWTMMLLWGIIAAVVTTASSLYHIYASIALGHLAKKHRIGWAVVAYLGINFVMSAIMVVAYLGINFVMSAIMGVLGNTRVLNHLVRWLEDITSAANGVQVVVFLELGCVAVGAVLTVVFFFITRQILEKRLNLE